MKFTSSNVSCRTWHYSCTWAIQLHIHQEKQRFLYYSERDEQYMWLFKRKTMCTPMTPHYIDVKHCVFCEMRNWRYWMINNSPKYNLSRKYWSNAEAFKYVVSPPHSSLQSFHLYIKTETRVQQTIIKTEILENRWTGVLILVFGNHTFCVSATRCSVPF